MTFHLSRLKKSVVEYKKRAKPEYCVTSRLSSPVECTKDRVNEQAVTFMWKDHV